VLLFQDRLPLHRVWARFSLGLLLVCALVAGLSRRGGDWWITGGSNAGLVLGLLAAAIIVFELLLLPRKRWPGFVSTSPKGTKVGWWLRPARTVLAFQTKSWLVAHIWLGLISLPIALMHSGLAFWNDWLSLPWCLGGCLVIVYVSGLYGLWLQQTLPSRLLREVPAEVPYADIDKILEGHRNDFDRRLVLEYETYAATDDPVTSAERLAGQRFHQFYEGTPTLPKYRAKREDESDQPDELKPQPGHARAYLHGVSRRTDLDSEALATATFRQLRAEIQTLLQPPRDAREPRADRTAEPPLISRRPLVLVDELEALCAQRRQLLLQKRLQARLHRWLHWVHLPASVLLAVLLLAHILTALKYL
jgi:hypothetical protein